MSVFLPHWLCFSLSRWSDNTFSSRYTVIIGSNLCDYFGLTNSRICFPVWTNQSDWGFRLGLMILSAFTFFKLSTNKACPGKAMIFQLKTANAPHACVGLVVRFSLHQKSHISALTWWYWSGLSLIVLEVFIDITSYRSFQLCRHGLTHKLTND